MQLEIQYKMSWSNTNQLKLSSNLTTSTPQEGLNGNMDSGKDFTDMMEFIVPTMVVYGLFTLVGISGLWLLYTNIINCDVLAKKGGNKLCNIIHPNVCQCVCLFNCQCFLSWAIWPYDLWSVEQRSKDHVVFIQLICQESARCLFVFL